MNIRLLSILRCFASHRLDSLLLDAFPSLAHRLWFRTLGALLPSAPLKLARGERLRQSFESLGPIFVKFGQLLSTRRDLLPEDIADAVSFVLAAPQRMDVTFMEIVPTDQSYGGSQFFRRGAAKPR